MAVAWFIGPYVRDDISGQGRPTRYFISSTFLQQVASAGGMLSGPAEILGNHGICKVRAGDGVLDAIASQPGVDRLNKDLLDESLSDLAPAIQQRLKDIATTLGYTFQQINNRFPNPIGTYTLGDVLRFYGTRWRRPYYNVGTDEILNEGVDREPPATVDTIRADTQ